MTVSRNGRELDLQLHLLDRQITDPDGRFIAKIDDLELEIGADGHPYVTAILIGPRPLGDRIGGRLGHWFTAIGQRFATTEHAPRIDFGHVTDIGDDIRINKTRRELGVDPLEDWVHDNVISRIPGSRHESQ
jgi:sporulation protein YlmC with PRC-barrel domain